MKVGVVLSGATTTRVLAQLTEEGERRVREGMLVVVRAGPSRLLARVTEIRSFNEFYEVGDVWSEARRLGMRIPETISKRYVICELELLGELPRLEDIRYPPEPGDPVELLESWEEVLKNVSRGGIHVMFGTLLGYRNAPVPLSIEALPMHLAVIGVTGSGKSYTVGYLLETLGRIEKDGRLYGYPAFVIDANGDYLDYYSAIKEGSLETGYRDAIRLVFSGSYASQNDPNAMTIKLDFDALSPGELAELVIDFYRTGEQLELPLSALESVFEEVRAQGIGYVEAFMSDDGYGLMKGMLSSMRIHPQTRGAAERALDNFRKELLKHSLLGRSASLDASLIDDVTENYKLAILDFSTDGATGVSVKVKQLVVAYLSIVLFKRFVDYKMGRVPMKSRRYNGARYALFIIEEAQNYCPNLAVYPVGSSVARKYLSLIATQGRKFGLGLVIVTQRPSFVDRIVLSMVNTFFLHRVSPEDVGFLRRLMGGVPDWLAGRLTSMRTGTVLIKGQMLPFSFPLLVRVPERRVKPTIGATYVSEYFG